MVESEPLTLASATLTLGQASLTGSYREKKNQNHEVFDNKDFIYLNDTNDLVHGCGIYAVSAKEISQPCII